jgi:peptide/nickel transport system permease protein
MTLSLRGPPSWTAQLSDAKTGEPFMAIFWKPAYLVGRRLVIVLITLAIVSFVVFCATSILPGDVAQIELGQANTPEAAAALRKAMGLDDPAILRYWRWFAGMWSGDLGVSYVTKTPVADLIGARLINTLKLAAVTTIVSVPISLLLGITAAMWRGTLYDRVVSSLSIFVISVPEFMVATLAVLVFAVWLHWLPALSYGIEAHSMIDILRAYAMPVITLGFVVSAQMIRMTRAAMIEAIDTPYVEMARLKGASISRMVLGHALPNALGPIANAIALALSYLIGGVIVVETIFNYPGISKLMLDAVSTRDLPLIQSASTIICAGYLILIMLADLVAILSNPRLRH